MDVIRTAADPKCSAHLVKITSTIDSILTNAPEIFKKSFKALFGLQELEHDDDFVSTLMVQIFSNCPLKISLKGFFSLIDLFGLLDPP